MHQLTVNLLCFPGDMIDSADTDKPEADNELSNEISAPYEVPQFPIEQIEKKLQIQRLLNEKWVPSKHSLEVKSIFISK